jgi:hypothetical protein
MTFDVTDESRERSACVAGGVAGEREFLFCSRLLMRSTDHMGRYNASARFMVPLQRGDAGNILVPRRGLRPHSFVAEQFNSPRWSLLV